MLARLVREVGSLEADYDFLKPSFVYKAFEKQFRKEEQHDAHEFLLHLFGQLSQVDHLFKGQLSQMLRC